MHSHADQVLPVTPAASAPGKGRVLLVDDEPVLRAMASTVLIAHGWEVMNASSAEESAELLKYCNWNRTSVDVVVLDLILPGGMSGMDAVAELARLQPGLRFVASSSFFAGEESRQLCMDLGFHDILPKPYTASALAEAVERNHPAAVRMQNIIEVPAPTASSYAAAA